MGTSVFRHISIGIKKCLRWRPIQLLKALQLAKTERPVVLAVGFSSWKESFVKNFYSGRSVLFVDDPVLIEDLSKILGDKLLIVAVWSFKNESLSVDLTHLANTEIWRIEDGFIRSIGRGLDHVPPWSLCVDRQGAYFDSCHPSDLEDLCQEFSHQDWTEEKHARANKLIQKMQFLSISKYNLGLSEDKTWKTNLDLEKMAVLVLGQVEDDQSIVRNNNAISTNSDLLIKAIEDHPDARIYFKQHPDCVGERKRNGFIDLSVFPDVYEVPSSIPLSDAIDLVKTVYTISSLGGLEALIRGKKVITFGCPFYAGWGLTTDHVLFPRRTQKLELEQLFHIAYLDYPFYFNPYTGQKLTAEAVIEEFSKSIEP